MSARLYLCPMVGTGVKGDAFRPLGANYASDWTAADADPNMNRFNPGGLLDGLNDIDSLSTFLRSHTVADLTPAQRTTALTKLTALGIDTSGLTTASTLMEVVGVIKAWFGLQGNDLGGWFA